ncbi:hypothetical protein FWK35_00000856, partial [Aphis craccivora]
NSKISGIVAKRDKKSFTFAKSLSPSLTKGVVGNILNGLIDNDPFFMWYKLLITNRRSDVFLTGKKRLLGTFIPRPPLNDFIAAPTAVSS